MATRLLIIFSLVLQLFAVHTASGVCCGRAHTNVAGAPPAAMALVAVDASDSCACSCCEQTPAETPSLPSHDCDCSACPLCGVAHQPEAILIFDAGKAEALPRTAALETDTWHALALPRPAAAEAGPARDAVPIPSMSLAAVTGRWLL